MSKKIHSLILPTEAETLAFGARLAATLKPPRILFLQGELGVGKTTLVRGLLKGLGFTGIGKSPTYTLVEPYELKIGSVYHFDLYRLTNPEELEFIGIRDYFNENAICLIEWPEHGLGFLPKADLNIELKIVPEGRLLTID